jgi:hypothetical protein
MVRYEDILELASTAYFLGKDSKAAGLMVELNNFKNKYFRSKEMVTAKIYVLRDVVTGVRLAIGGIRQIIEAIRERRARGLTMDNCQIVCCGTIDEDNCLSTSEDIICTEQELLAELSPINCDIAPTCEITQDCPYGKEQFNKCYNVV